MGFMATIKAQQAMRAHGKGDLEQAKKLYEEAIDKGLTSARPMLGYAILLIREGSYDKAMPLLIKAQKCPDLTPDQKSQLFVDYAACLMKKGELDKAIHLLEKQHNRAPIGLTYQTLGYMYVEKYSGAKPVAEAAPEKAAEAPEMPEAPETEASAEAAEEQPKVKAQEDIDREWQEGIDKMFAFIQESVDYDDEDPVCLDNLGQAYYRVTGEKDKAKEWFDKAHAEKDSQIDTLWFLSRYDLEAGDKAAAIAKLEKALALMGIPLPPPDKPPGRYNNRKITFDAMNRLMLIEIAKAHGLDIEEQVKYGGKTHLEKLDYIIAKQLETIRNQQVEKGAKHY